MKQFGNLKTLLATGAAFAAVSTFGSLQAQEQGHGVVRKITGTASFQVGGGVWTPLKVGDNLPPGSTIKGDKESLVYIYLGAANGPSLQVKDDTTVSIDTLNYTGSGPDAVSETKLNLQDGEILGSVRKLGADSKYEIKTPTGVAGIRGTDYDITTRKNNAGKYETVYICVTGTIVGADNGNGPMTSFVANSGQTFQAGGVQPTPPNTQGQLQTQIHDGNTFNPGPGGGGPPIGGNQNPNQGFVSTTVPNK